MTRVNATNTTVRNVNNIVWILGGASSFGLELAKEAMRRDMVVHVLGRRAPKGATCQYVDLSNNALVTAICDSIDAGDLDVLLKNISFFVWNASVYEYSPFDKMENLSEMIDINVHNPTIILQSLIRRKKILNSPFHLITISSRASWKAFSNQAVYSGTKAYQAQLSRSIAQEFKVDLPGARVTVVLPARMKTNIFHETPIDSSSFMEQHIVAEVLWESVLSQEMVYDELSVYMVDREITVSHKISAPELAYEKLPKKLS